MLPEYLPGVHPLVVHFPIVLLIVGVLVDAWAVLLGPERKLQPHVRVAAAGLLLIGAVSLPLTYWTGTRAGDALASPFVQADAAVAEHADWAWWTMWFFLAVIALRIALQAVDRLPRGAHLALAVAGLAGLVLLYETAEHGGRLVYDLGVGVRPVREAPEGAFEPEPEIDPRELGPARSEDGSLRWRFQPGAERVLAEHLSVVRGAWPTAMVQAREAALVLEPSAGPTILALEPEYDLVNLRISFEGREFDGALGLLHHIRGDDYDYLILDGGSLRLGRRAAGEDTVLERAEIELSPGWHELEVVAAGDHFRGYVDGELLVHGHAGERSPGRVGVLIDGAGALALDDLRVTPLDSE